MLSARDFEEDLEDLSTAEDFLEYFGIEYRPSVVQVNRLHILQRFHDYLEKVEVWPEGDRARFELHASLLKAAYEDFVRSDPSTEKVFKVFQSQESRGAFVPVTDVIGRCRET